jgi:Na+/phosphate symporter
MSGDSRFGAMCAGTIFYLLGGVYLVTKTEHVTWGEVFIGIGVAFLGLALHEAVKPTRR